MNLSPCLGCKERKGMGICHDTCMKYAAFKQIAATIKEAKLEYNNTLGIHAESRKRYVRNN